MRVLVPGHRYALRNLKDEGESILQFYQDPAIHEGSWAPGPSTQEVIRACIDRVQTLDSESPWDGNDKIILSGLRRALIGFEVRALLLHTDRGQILPELIEVGDDGHFKFVTKGN